MPYELLLPNALRPWKVKIFDNELLFEEPHVTIIFKSTRWRFSLRSRNFLDKSPEPSQVPSRVVAQIEANLETLCDEWNARFPTNPIAQLEEEE
jgi:hypothetical protein